MRSPKNQNIALDRLIPNRAHAHELRLAEACLHRWHERECGDSSDHASWVIERDEESGKPYLVTHFYRHNTTTRYAIRDMHKAAIRRVERVLQNYPGLSFYVQGDPRGCALYILRPGDVRPDAYASSCYTNGIAAY